MNKSEQEKAKLLGDAIRKLLAERQISQRGLARRAGLTPDYVNKLVNGQIANPGEEKLNPILATLEISKTALEKLIERNRNIREQPNQDWGEAPYLPDYFRGRTQELTDLQRYIAQHHRIVALSGKQGIGKTTLAVKLAELIKEQFDCFIWLTLRNAPPINEILNKLLDFLSSQSSEPVSPKFPTITDELDNTDNKIKRIVQYLRTIKTLIVLDNVESILQEINQEYIYKNEHQKYSDLLRNIGEQLHKSCAIIIGQEFPSDFKEKFYQLQLPIVLLPIRSLKEEEERDLLTELGCYSNSEDDWRNIIDYCQGYPLILKIVGQDIEENFDGDISKYIESEWAQDIPEFNDIGEFLEKRFEKKLSETEQEIMYWLAIERKPVTDQELCQSLYPKKKKSTILNNLHYLVTRHSLIEEKKSGFTQLPIVMEFVTKKIIQRSSQEIRKGDLIFLNQYSLFKSQSNPSIRDKQLRLIIRKIIDELCTQQEEYKVLKDKLNNLEYELNNLLANWQKRCPKKEGYLANNIINLLLEIQAIQQKPRDFSHRDFSNLTIWQASFEGVTLHDTDFSNSDFTNSVFSDTLTSINCVTFRPNQESCYSLEFATGESNGNIRLWKGNSSNNFLIFEKNHPDQVWTIAFSPDGKTLASGGQNGYLYLWNVGTGRPYRQDSYVHHDSSVYSVAFSPDGQFLASGGGDGIIKLWKTGTHLRLTHNGWKVGAEIHSVTFSPDGTTLASGGADGAVVLWDINTNTGTPRPLYSSGGDLVRSVAFSPDGSLIAVGDESGTVNLVETNTGKIRQSLNAPLMKLVRVIAFKPDGEAIATASDDRIVRVWDVETGQCQLTFQGHSNHVRAITWSPDGKTLLTGSDDRSFRLWNAETQECYKMRQGGFTNRVWSVAFSPDSKTLASGDEDQTINLWDIEKKEYRTLPGHSDWVWSVVFSQDGELLASSSEDHTVKLWNAKTHELLRELVGHKDRVRFVAFSPDGKIVASASNDRTVKLWDIDRGICLRTLEGHFRRVLSVDFHPHQPILASSSRDNTIKLWNIETGVSLNTLAGHYSQVHSVVFSPDGQFLASGSFDKTIKLWESDTGKPLKTFLGHSDQILSVTFSPDGETLASSGHDRTVRLWDVSTSQCLYTLRGHKGAVESVAFSRDGKILASGSQDETIRLWNPETGKEWKPPLLQAKKLYEGMKLKDIKGLDLATIATLEELGANTSD